MIIYIPGPLIALATFPGIVIHEVAHRLACDLLHIPVYEIRYFSMSFSESGSVTHERIENIRHSFLIAIAPLLLNTVVCAVFTAPFVISLATGVLPANFIITLILFWVGFSAGIHALPSTIDVDNVLALIHASNGSHRRMKLFIYCIKFFNWMSLLIRFFYTIFVIMFSIFVWLLMYFILGAGYILFFA